MARPARSISAARPRRRRMPSVPGLSESPHSLSRGKLARSTIRTRAPARASTVAAIAPAGPAPTTRTSSTGDYHRAVLRPEPEAIAERGADAGQTALIGYVVEVARRIGIGLIDRRRQESARHRERRGHDARGAAGALRVSDHRLD